MIVEGLVSIAVGLLVFVGELLPDMNTPGWVDSIAGHVSTVTSQMAALGAWVPFGAAGNATMLVLSAVAVAVAVRAVRMVLSVFTGGGGA